MTLNDMRRCAALLGLNVFLAVPAVAQHRVECLGANGPRRWEFEAPDLKKAPHGAYRVDKYRLVVNLAKGTRQFVDTAPYMEADRGGTANQYCGFDAATHMHVLSYQTEFVTSGYLIDDRTGALLPGGQWVHFSPDNKRYLAGAQSDGAEYPDWAVYMIGGRLLTKGVAMTCADPRDHCAGELSNPQWTDNTHIQATTKCDDKTVLHTLDVSQARWSWRPEAPCPTDATKEYEQLLERHEATFKRGGDSAMNSAALRTLEPRLRAIVGPFPVPGFIQPGRMNNDDMFESDEEFDKADGIRYQWPDSDVAKMNETIAVVTTEPLIRAWLQRRSGIDSTVPLDVAFARDNVLSWAFPFDAAAVPYAQIPRDTLDALGLSWGWIGNFEQDDCPCAAAHAVFMVTRGQQVVLVALNLQRPIPPPETCLAEWKKAGDRGEWDKAPVAFRACYAREVVRDPRFGRIVAEIRELTSRVRRQ